MTRAVLPPNRTPWEAIMADTMAISALTEFGIGAMRRAKYVNPRLSMLPFLVWEYGLGELTPYVPNLYALIDQGVRWQRIRGTHQAVAVCLDWIGYEAAIEEAWTGRRYWNSFQLRFPELPAHDYPDLERIEGITTLSVPKRSRLRRGVYQYDAQPIEADATRLDETMLERESGIAVTQAGTLWSFGRCHEFEHFYSEADGVAIGNWVPDTGGGLLWKDMLTLWVDANFLWADDPALQRQQLLAGYFSDRPLWIAFVDGDGEVIGFRRCRSRHVAVQSSQGPLIHGEQHYEPRPGGSLLYAEALTDFGDADGVTCKSLALVVNASPAPGIPPGRRWLGPDDLTGGVQFAEQAVDIPMRATVREQVKFLLRF